MSNNLQSVLQNLKDAIAATKNNCKAIKQDHIEILATSNCDLSTTQVSVLKTILASSGSAQDAGLVAIAEGILNQDAATALGVTSANLDGAKKLLEVIKFLTSHLLTSDQIDAVFELKQLTTAISQVNLDAIYDINFDSEVALHLGRYALTIDENTIAVLANLPEQITEEDVLKVQNHQVVDYLSSAQKDAIKKATTYDAITNKLPISEKDVMYLAKLENKPSIYEIIILKNVITSLFNDSASGVPFPAHKFPACLLQDQAKDLTSYTYSNSDAKLGINLVTNGVFKDELAASLKSLNAAGEDFINAQGSGATTLSDTNAQYLKAIATGLPLTAAEIGLLKALKTAGATQADILTLATLSAQGISMADVASATLTANTQVTITTGTKAVVIPAAQVTSTLVGAKASCVVGLDTFLSAFYANLIAAYYAAWTASATDADLAAISSLPVTDAVNYAAVVHTFESTAVDTEITAVRAAYNSEDPDPAQRIIDVSAGHAVAVGSSTAASKLPCGFFKLLNFVDEIPLGLVTNSNTLTKSEVHSINTNSCDSNSSVVGFISVIKNSDNCMRSTDMAKILNAGSVIQSYVSGDSDIVGNVVALGWNGFTVADMEKAVVCSGKYVPPLQLMAAGSTNGIGEQIVDYIAGAACDGAEVIIKLFGGTVFCEDAKKNGLTPSKLLDSFCSNMSGLVDGSKALIGNIVFDKVIGKAGTVICNSLAKVGDEVAIEMQKNLCENLVIKSLFSEFCNIGQTTENMLFAAVSDPYKCYNVVSPEWEVFNSALSGGLSDPLFIHNVGQATQQSIGGDFSNLGDRSNYIGTIAKFSLDNVKPNTACGAQNIYFNFTMPPAYDGKFKVHLQYDDHVMISLNNKLNTTFKSAEFDKYYNNFNPSASCESGVEKFAQFYFDGSDLYENNLVNVTLLTGGSGRGYIEIMPEA